MCRDPIPKYETTWRFKWIEVHQVRKIIESYYPREHIFGRIAVFTKERERERERGTERERERERETDPS